MYRKALGCVLGVVLAFGSVPVSQVQAAATPYQPLTVQREPVVKGGDLPTKGFEPDAAAVRALREPPPAPVWPKPAVAEIAATGKVGDLPVKTSGNVRVRVLDSGGQPKVLLRVARIDAGAPQRVELSVDYRGFRHAYGSDWENRLRFVHVPECEGCAATPVPSRRDVTGWVTAEMTASAGEGTLYALEAAASGPTGDFSASTLAPSATWGVDGNSGDFTWNYPLRTPPALNGPAPKLSLAYSAQSVDGRHAATNNQPSWIGEGFELWPGYVERRYRLCADDLGGNNGQTKTGDLCWATDNALLVLGGTAVELIKVSATANIYRPRRDDGSRIELLKDTTNGTGDRFGEYWKVTTADGTKYFFGRNKLPGYTSGAETTQATWTVPVFGNHTGEPCNASTFDSSYCQLPWKWNLDYVEDPNGNAMSLWYGRETNKYARNLTSSKVSVYARGGWLKRIDYGTRNTTAYGTPPMRVVFTPGDRCLSNCTTHGANWPDTPWDQECTGTTCNKYSPTFWTTKRLASITTQVLKGTTLSNVESWTLKHTFPDPGDTTRAGLWLAAIGHTGVPADVKFSGIQLDNRVDANDHSPAMKWWRIRTIHSEFGGVISITYSAPECVAGSKVPTQPEANTLRCYPSKWTPQGYTDPITDYFHKYVAVQVDENDLSGGSPKVTTRYEYPNPPAWHYTDEDGLVAPRYRTWSVWRGYDLVRTIVGEPGEQTYTEARYYRGMHGDKLPSGTRSVSVPDSEGNAVVDHEAFAGRERETAEYNATDGSLITAAAFDMWQSNPTASRTIDGHTVHARYANVDVERSRTTLDGGRAPRRTLKQTTYDERGMPVSVDDRGDAARDDDDMCMRYIYNRTDSPWMTRLARTRTEALRCDQSPSTADDVISDVKHTYDSKGNNVRSEALSGWVDGRETYYTSAQATYDSYGRVVTFTDTMGRSATVTYTPASGPVTRTTTSNALGHAIVRDFDPAFGLVTKTVDQNNRVTVTSYDSLGRLTSVWLPGRDTGQTANIIYSYRLPQRLADDRPDGVVAVTTKTLGPNGNYTVSHDLYDGLLRQRQTQDPAGDGSGGRIVSDTFHNSAGRAYKSNFGYYTTGAPSTVLFDPAGGDAQIEAQSLTLFDGAGRRTAEILRRYGTELWRTTYAYGGDRVEVTPPAGGTRSATITDARDNTTERRTYRADGTFDAIRYVYNRKDQLSEVIDPQQNRWTYLYDVRGRQVVATDPDKGTNRLTYNDADQIVTTTDSRNRTLSYTYDQLGRKTSMSEGPVKLAEWIYDTAPGGTGMLAATVRQVGTDQYRNEVTGYNPLGRPSGTKVTIPAVEGKLAGTYTFSATYNIAGGLATTTLPATGGLPRETLGYTYDDLGKPVRLTNVINFTEGTYVENTQYTQLGEPGVYTFALSSTDASVEQGFTYEGTTRRLVRTVTKKETAVQPLSDVSYTWDPAGNLTSTKDSAVSDFQCYSYGYLRQLAEAWTPSNGDCAAARSGAALGGPAPYWHSYEYDNVGNRTLLVRHGATPEQDERVTYSYAGNSHALLSTSAGSYAYEAGNTISRPGPSGQQSLTWDAEGKLAMVTDSSGTSSYVYDLDGNRLISRDPASSTLHLPGMELRWDKSSDTVNGTRFYRHGGVTIAQRDAAGVTWLMPDRQGTAHLSIGATAEQPVTRRYQTPFGEARGASSSWPNRHGFLDATNDRTGTVHLGAREYDPSIGRFLSVDPVFDGENVLQMQGYAYANNNPVTIADPSGLYVTAGGPGDEGKGCQYNCTTTGTKKKKQKSGGSGGASKGGGGKSGWSWETTTIGGKKYVVQTKWVSCTMGPCVPHRQVRVMGPEVPCIFFAGGRGRCYMASDGYIHDTDGHMSCAKGYEWCGQARSESKLPTPIAGGVDYPAPAPQAPNCETPGSRRPPGDYFRSADPESTIRAHHTPMGDLRAMTPGTLTVGASMCWVGLCAGIAVHEEGINFTYGMTLPTPVPTPGLSVGYQSAPASMQGPGTVEACAGYRVSGCYSTGPREKGGQWHGFGLAAGGGVSGSVMFDKPIYWWSCSYQDGPWGGC